MTGVQHFPVEADDGTPRLDRWLRRRFPHVSQGRIERMCRKGEIRIDGSRAKASARLVAGQIVRVPPLDESPPERAGSGVQRPVSDADAALIRSCVIYRDEDLIAINKPYGLAVQGGTGQSDRHVDALAEALRFEKPEKPRLIHRIDRETSGVLLMARSAAAAAALGRSFRRREARKLYWAVVEGAPRPSEGEVTYALVKGQGQHGGEAMRTATPETSGDLDGVRAARSRYRVIEALGNRLAWVALSPITGRTHQLRVHMAAIGHPIVGDFKYGDRPTDGGVRQDGALLGAGLSRKLHLHARSLSLAHPTTGAPVELTAPLPDHMDRTWREFGWEIAQAPSDPFGEAT